MIWYAIRVAPQREFIAERLLKDDGFYAFVPIEHRLLRPNRFAKRGAQTGRRELVRMPMMPGYLFVGFEPDEPQRWLDLFRFRMVQSVVGERGRPAEFHPNAMIRIFHMSQRVHIYRKSDHARKRFKFKHSAEIVNGPYQGRRVVVTEIIGNKAKQIFEQLKEGKVA